MEKSLFSATYVFSEKNDKQVRCSSIN